MATISRREPDVRVIGGISYKSYVRMIYHPTNRHIRMGYHNGTLEIVSPIYFAHEGASRKLSYILTSVAEALNLPYHGTGGTTWHRAGDGPFKGVGKEPDQGFFLGSVARFPFDREPSINAGDPPPDLWVEVDHRVSSRGRLPVYAELGVPEVWQYRVNRKKLRILRLVDGSYQPTKRSLALPILTNDRILEALALGEEQIESEFVRRLRAWIPGLIARAANDPLPD